MIGPGPDAQAPGFLPDVAGGSVNTLSCGSPRLIHPVVSTPRLIRCLDRVLAPTRKLLIGASAPVSDFWQVLDGYLGEARP
jgi:hypothetical protein